MNPMVYSEIVQTDDAVPARGATAAGVVSARDIRRGPPTVIDRADGGQALAIAR